MTDLIDPTLLSRPEIRAAFPPTARKSILLPIITYINMLSSNANSLSYLDSSYEQTFDQSLSNLQQQLSAALTRIAALEAILNVTQGDAIADLPASSAVSISVTNLANIGLLSSNENDDRKTINKFLALFRLHGWIKP